MQTLAASARLWANLVEAAVHIAVELKNAAPGLMAAVSPKYLMLQVPPMAGSTESEMLPPIREPIPESGATCGDCRSV